MISVVNIRKINQADTDIVYIGRGSPLGNPFKVGEDGTRDQVISKFRSWLRERVERNNTEIRVALFVIACRARHGDIRLACYCDPLPCHGSVIKEVVDDYLLTGELSVR